MLPPHVAMIGAPFYKPFQLLALQPEEIVAEKMRTLVQRVRPSDLVDMAMLITAAGDELDRDVIAHVAERKFELVAGARQRRLEKLQLNLTAIGAGYEATIIDIGAGDSSPSYEDACQIVRAWIEPLVP